MTYREKLRGKMNDKARKCLMIGYAKHHPADTYRLYDPQTRKVILSRDVAWEEWKRANPKRDLEVFNEDPTYGIEEDFMELEAVSYTHLTLPTIA